MSPEKDAEALVTKSFIGMTEIAARKRAVDLRLPVRTVRRDGRYAVVTRDFVPERINLSVQDGKVYHVTRG